MRSASFEPEYEPGDCRYLLGVYMLGKANVFGIGGVAEWFMAPVLETGDARRRIRGFESPSLISR